MQPGPISQNQDKPVSCSVVGVSMKLKHHQVEDYMSGCGYAVIAEFIWNLPKDQRIEAYKILATKQIFPDLFSDKNFINKFESFIEILTNHRDKNFLDFINDTLTSVCIVEQGQEIIEESSYDTNLLGEINKFFSSLTSVGLTENQIFQRYFIEQFINSLSQKTEEGLTQNERNRHVFDHKLLTEKFPKQQFSSQLESNYIEQDTIFKLFIGLFGDQYGFGFNETQEEIFSANPRMKLLIDQAKSILTIDESQNQIISCEQITFNDSDDDEIRNAKSLLFFALSFKNHALTGDVDVFANYTPDNYFKDKLQVISDQLKNKLIQTNEANQTEEISIFYKIANYLKFFFQNFYSHQQQLLNLDNSYFLQVATEENKDGAGKESHHFSLFLPEKQTDQLPTLNSSTNLYLKAHQEHAIEQTFKQLNKNLAILTSSDSNKSIDKQEIEITEFRPAIYHDRKARKDDNFRYFQETTLFSPNEHDQSQENTKASPLELIFKAINDANKEDITKESSPKILNEEEITLAIFLAKKFGGIGTKSQEVKKYLIEKNVINKLFSAETTPENQNESKIDEYLAKLKKFSRQFQFKSKEAGIYSGNQNLTSERAKKYGLRLAFVPDEIFINKVNKIQDPFLKELITKDLNEKINKNMNRGTVVTSSSSLSSSGLGLAVP